MIRLAWKNLWRNKTRSAIIIVAIAIGVIGGTFYVAFYNGIIYQRVEDAIGNETSHIQIHSTHFLENKEITDTIPYIEKITPILDTISVIKGYSVRFKTMAMINSANSSTGILILGVDPQAEKKTTSIWNRIEEGKFFPAEKKNTIIIGRKLANKLKVKLNSKVVVTFQNLNGELVSSAFKIAGIYNTGNTGFDERVVYVNKNEIFPIASDAKSIAHEIAIALTSDNSSTILANKIGEDLPFVDVKTWKELYPEVGLMTNYANYLQLIFMTIIFLALSFGIINTMLMAVMERTREIGMLMAIGMSKLRIFQMISYETILLMLTGTVAGMVLSYILIIYFGSVGINLSAFAKGLNQMGFSALVYPVITIREFIHTILLVFIAGLLSSLIPARKALRLSPSEALRKQ